MNSDSIAVMHSEPVTITTEKVSYADMSSREKQIYDTAFCRGREIEKDDRKFTRMHAFLVGVLFGLLFLIFYHLNSINI